MEVIFLLFTLWLFIVIPWALWKACCCSFRVMANIGRGFRRSFLRWRYRPRAADIQIAEARRRAEQAAQKRREDARAAVELLFALYKPEIGDRFPQSAFDAFLAKYMRDNQSAEYVEERARQLHDIVLQHREKAAPTPKFKSLADLTAWFEAQRHEIDQVPDERMRKRMLVQLKERYSDLTSQLLEEI